MTEPGKRVPAHDLYGGDHWSVATSIPKAGQKNGLSVSLWVASAGYGLISAAAEISPYGATFSSDAPDFVYANLDHPPSAWWAGLNAWRDPAPGQPRSIAELAAASPTVPIVLAVSPPYLRALRADILAARSALKEPELLTVFSTARGADPELEPSLVSSDARFQSLVSGSRQSLNVRLVRRAIQEAAASDLRSSVLRDRFGRALASLPDAPSYDRGRLGDDQVRDFIRQALRTNPRAPKTRLLRELRDGGHACEQGRFSGLYDEVSSERLRG